jgi:hypothetical protein
MSFPESAITVGLCVAQGQVAAVEIQSTRKVKAAQLLAGRKVAEAVALLPAIFSLCGTAQGLAGARAVEAALGLAETPAQKAARDFLVLMEGIAEHAQTILRDWPPLLGDPPDLVGLKALRPLVAAARRALYPDGDWTRPGGGRLVPDKKALVAVMADVSRQVSRLPEEGQSVARRLSQRIMTEGLAGFGRCPFHPMPDCGPADLAARLEADTDGAYLGLPDAAGLVLETTPLARQAGDSAIQGLMAAFGNGLLPRLAARLTELSVSLRDAARLMQDLQGDPGAGEALAGSGTGIGLAPAARGLLVHRVEVRDGVLGRYQILAPTEWNFHPKGPLAQGLEGAEATPDLDWRARLLVAALDPCVACTVEVRNA